MPHLFADYETRVDELLQNAKSHLTQGVKDDFIHQAITQRYSNDRPRDLVSDVAGSGTNDQNLPVGPNQEAFEIGFSQVKTVEYPIGQIPESYLLNDDWKLYASPAGTKIRLLTTTVPASASVRFGWTVRHAEDGSTIPDADFYAVCDFAASLCCESIAAYFADTRDPGIAADTVNYRTKAQEFLTQAKAFRTRYYNQMGIAEGEKTGAASQGPAIALGDFNETLAVGLDRMTHPKSTRR